MGESHLWLAHNYNGKRVTTMKMLWFIRRIEEIRLGCCGNVCGLGGNHPRTHHLSNYLCPPICVHQSTLMCYIRLDQMQPKNPPIKEGFAGGSGRN